MSPFDVKTNEISSLCQKYHVRSLHLFGSMARGESHPESDIDLLVSFTQPVTLLQMVAFERELSTLLGQKVDLVTEASISPYLRTRILQDQRQVYAA